MQNVFLIIISSCLSQLCFSQISDPNWKNLIPNYSFEVVTNEYPVNPGGGIGPTGLPDYYCHGGAAFSDYENWIKGYWSEVYEWTHPLRRNSACALWNGVAVGTANVLRDFDGSTNARSGINYGFGTSGEFLVVPLWHGGIKQGKTYFVEVFRNSTSISPSNMFLSQGQTRQCGNNEIKSPSNNGLLVKALDLESSSQGWHRTKSYISFPFDYTWATFGHEDAGGDWDDLRIYEVEENGCRENWYFDNTVFNYPLEFFQASNNIYVGNGVDPENGINHIPGDVIQYANTQVILQAENQVIIDNTFIMEPGSWTLIIENKPCQDDDCPEKLEFEDYILCDIPSMQIGTSPNSWGTSVTWYPSIYLDNPTVSNPTFTSPGGTGSMNYTVTVQYYCDKGFEYTSSFPVTVQYVNTNDPTAWITANNTSWDVYNFSTDFEFSEGVTEITIEVDGQTGYSETFMLGEDFECCSMYWELFEAWRWSSCEDNTIKVTAKNKCSGAEDVIELSWPKTTIPFEEPPYLPNALTLDGPPNNELCLIIPSADNYEAYVINVWGNVVNDITSGPVEDNTLCIWAPEQGSLSDGVYTYVLTLTDECGNEVEVHSFIHIFNGMVINNTMTQTGDDSEEFDNRTLNEDEEIHHSDSKEERLDIFIFPNPTDNSITIFTESLIEKSVVYDFQGKKVYEQFGEGKTINLSPLSPGMYWVEIHSNEGVHIEKIIRL